MFGMNGFHVSASGAIQGHHGPLVDEVTGLELELSTRRKAFICPSKTRHRKSPRADSSFVLLCPIDMKLGICVCCNNIECKVQGP